MPTRHNCHTHTLATRFPQDLIQEYVAPSDKTLVVGAGTSRLTEELWAVQTQRVSTKDKGQTSVSVRLTNIDFSTECVMLLTQR